jgi:hypothetical protein
MAADQQLRDAYQHLREQGVWVLGVPPQASPGVVGIPLYCAVQFEQRHFQRLTSAGKPDASVPALRVDAVVRLQALGDAHDVRRDLLR